MDVHLLDENNKRNIKQQQNNNNNKRNHLPDFIQIDLELENGKATLNLIKQSTGQSQSNRPWQ